MQLSSSDKNLDDATNYNTVMSALNTIEMPLDEQRELIEIIAGVLNLGNIIFGEDEMGQSLVYENESVHAFANVSIFEDFFRMHIIFTVLKFYKGSWDRYSES